MTAHQRSEEAERDLWERLQSTQTEVEFREFVLEQLPLRPADSILSVGWGRGSRRLHSPSNSVSRGRHWHRRERVGAGRGDVRAYLEEFELHEDEAAE